MPDGVQLPSVSLAELLQRVQEHPCWTTPLPGPNQGRGLAPGLWTMPGGTTSCHITLSADGSVTLVLGTVANAIYRAVGVRLQELPMTPERLHWALQQQGDDDRRT